MFLAMSNLEVQTILDNIAKQSLLEILSEKVDVESMLMGLPRKELIFAVIKKQVGDKQIPNYMEADKINSIYNSLKSIVGVHLADTVRDVLMRPILLNELKSIVDIHSLDPIESKKYLVPLLDFEESYVNTQSWRKAATLLEIADKLAHNITGSIKSKMEARINNDWGIYYWKRGKYELSESKFKLALESAQKTKDDKLLAKVYYGLGVLYGDYEGDKNIAIEYNEKSLDILSRIGESDPSLMRMKASIFNNIGVAYHKMADIDLESREEHLRDAAKNYENSIKISRDIGYSYMEGWVLFNAGEVYAFLGDLEKAEQCSMESRDIFENTLRNDKGLSGVEMLDAIIYMQKGELDEAVKHVNESLELREKLKEPRRIADALVLRGDIYLRLDDAESAGKDYKTALEIYHSINSKDSVERVEGKLKNYLTN